MTIRTVLIFGHTGFIGRHIAATFSSTDFQVFGFTPSTGLQKYFYKNSSESYFVSVDVFDILSSLLLISPSICLNTAGKYIGFYDILDANINFVLEICNSIKSYSKSSNMPLQFAHISSLGVLSPYSSSATHTLNSYELSKSIAESIITSFFSHDPSIKLFIFRPSIVLHKYSSFQSRLRLLFLLSPFSFRSNDFIIPYIYIDDLSCCILSFFLASSYSTDTIFINLSTSSSLNQLHHRFLSSSRLYRFLSKFKPIFPSLIALISRSKYSYYIPCKPFSISLNRYLQIMSSSTTCKLPLTKLSL